MRKATTGIAVGVSGSLLSLVGAYLLDVYSSARLVRRLEKAYRGPAQPGPTMRSAVLRVLISDWRHLHYPKWALTVFPKQLVRGTRHYLPK